MSNYRPDLGELSNNEDNERRKLPKGVKTAKQLIQQTYSWKISQVRMIRSRFKTTLSTEIYSPELEQVEKILNDVENRCRENMKARIAIINETQTNRKA